MTVPLLGAERSAEEAVAVAAQFLTQSQSDTGTTGYQAPKRDIPSLRLAHTYKKKTSENPAFYVFNRTDNAGFVVVSADDRTEDVPMYADKGQFDAEHINPNMQFWLNRLQEEITHANDSNAVDKSTPRKLTTAIGPLLVNAAGQEIGWYQETPYNNYCPIDKLDNTRSLTGCVATAAAMVMYKWRYPLHGTGQSSYVWEDCLDWSWNGTCRRSSDTTLTADYGNTTYDWDNILPTYEGVRYTSAQADAVATLMYQLGVACEMIYGGDEAGGSGAYTDFMGRALKNHFGYNVEKFVTTYSEYEYGFSMMDNSEFGVDISTFETYFNADLEAGRPIIIGGETSNDGAHEFVCDGRNSNGYFHINWGWEGDGNCYCLLSALKPSTYSYTFDAGLDALIGVEPGVIDTIHVTDVIISPSQKTLKINEKATFTALILPVDASITQVTWSSSDTDVVVVNAAGLAKGVGPGTALLTATSNEGTIQGSATVTVTNEVLLTEEFTLVTNANELSDGDEVILVGTCNRVHYGAATPLQMGKMSNYFPVEEVEIVGNDITLSDTSKVLILTIHESEGIWTLSNSANQLLGAATERKVLWNNGDDGWTISISNAHATLTNSVQRCKWLMNYNEDNPRFSTYSASTGTSSTLIQPQLYSRAGHSATSIQNLILEKQGNKAVKFIQNGRFYIRKGGRTYTILGTL